MPSCDQLAGNAIRSKTLVGRIVARYVDDPILKKFMGKISSARSDLFRFVLNPQIPPTNNVTECGLQEIVVH